MYIGFGSSTGRSLTFLFREKFVNFLSDTLAEATWVKMSSHAATDGSWVLVEGADPMFGFVREDVRAKNLTALDSKDRTKKWCSRKEDVEATALDSTGRTR